MDSDDKISFSTILASTIHDVKNSLGIVLNSVDELVQTLHDVVPADKLGKLQHEAERVNHNLIQLLTLYKMENQQLSANIDQYSVIDFLEEVLMPEKSILALNGITLEIQCEDSLEWYFDRDLMSGVIGNAINNAVRYTRDRLLVSATEHDDYLVLSINDNGDGFPLAMIDGVPRAGHGVSFSHGHTGLGLYFTQIVTGLHKNQGRHGLVTLSNGGPLGGGCLSVQLP